MNPIKRLFLHRKYKKVLRAAQCHYDSLSVKEKQQLALDPSILSDLTGFSFISALSYESIRELGLFGFSVQSPLFDERCINRAHNAVLCAFMLDNEDAVIALSELGSGVGSKECSPPVDPDGMSPLFLAVRHGMLRAIRHFVDRGCNVNAQDSSGCTPLRLALSKPDVMSVKVLLEVGASVSEPGDVGYSPFAPTALIRLVNNLPRSPEVDKITLELVRGGCSLDHPVYENGAFWYPLSVYIRKCIPEKATSRSRRVIKAFVDRNAQDEFDDIDGLEAELTSPLYLCMKHGRYDLLRILLGRRERMEVGETVKYHTAAAVAHPSQLKVLLANCDGVLLCIKALLAMPHSNASKASNSSDSHPAQDGTEKEPFLSDANRLWMTHFAYAHRRLTVDDDRDVCTKLIMEILHLMSMAFPGYCRYQSRSKDSILDRVERMTRESPKVYMAPIILDYIHANPLPTLFDLLLYRLEAIDILEDMRHQTEVTLAQ